MKRAAFVIITLLLSATAHSARPSCEAMASGERHDAGKIKKQDLFASSKLIEDPIEIDVRVSNWTNIHRNPDRDKAKSGATYVIDGYTYEGSIEARGKSRFNNYQIRAMRFFIGDSDFKMVTRVGGPKGEPAFSSKINDARILIEYLIYKMYETLYPEESFKTRLAKVEFSNRRGKVLDSGFAFFVEGRGGVAKRLGYEEDGTYFNFGEGSPDRFRGDLFRKFILDRDESNMANNYVYLIHQKDDATSHRIPYDFDNSALVPPYSVSEEALRGVVLAGFKTWLNETYQAANRQRRTEMREEIHHFLDHAAELRKLYSDERVTQPFRGAQILWFDSAIKALKDFVESV